MAAEHNYGDACCGRLLSGALNPTIQNWAVVVSIVLMAGWILVPEKLDEDRSPYPKKRWAYLRQQYSPSFLQKWGGKTQTVTIALAARYHDFFSVVGGTTLEMMIANGPVIYLGRRFANKLPIKTVHIIMSIIFVVLGGLAFRNALLGIP